MNEFKRLKFDNIFYGYYETSKLSNNQTISIFFLLEEQARADEYNVVLAIANKKKHIKEWITGERDLFEEKTTGRCGLEGLIWAKRKIIEFEEFIGNRYRKGSKETIITVQWTNNRRRNVYEKGLKKLDYQIGYRDKQKCLFKRIK